MRLGLAMCILYTGFTKLIDMLFHANFLVMINTNNSHIFTQTNVRLTVIELTDILFMCTCQSNINNINSVSSWFSFNLLSHIHLLIASTQFSRIKFAMSPLVSDLGDRE